MESVILTQSINITHHQKQTGHTKHRLKLEECKTIISHAKKEQHIKTIAGAFDCIKSSREGRVFRDIGRALGCGKSNTNRVLITSLLEEQPRKLDTPESRVLI